MDNVYYRIRFFIYELIKGKLKKCRGDYDETYFDYYGGYKTKEEALGEIEKSKKKLSWKKLVIVEQVHWSNLED